MTRLELILLVIIAGLLAFIYFTRKSPELIIGPSQAELDSFKAESVRKSDSLKNALQALRATRTKDSIRYVSERTNSSKAISYWKKRVSESKEHLSDSLPDSTLVIEQAKVIVLQDSVIEKQGKRIVNDSLYIESLQVNFDNRLANELQQRELLEQENKLQSGVIREKDNELKRRKKASTIKTIIIGGLLILIAI